LWHGANWTFVVWGFLHACFILPLILLKKNRTYLGPIAENRLFSTFPEFFQVLATFLLVNLAWIFFRCDSLPDALTYLQGIFHPSILDYPKTPDRILGLFIAILLLTEWFQRNKEHGLSLDGGTVPRWIRWPIYGYLTYCIIYHGGQSQDFIYFQF
ncbi:MAG: MBOAT family protein, partial [Verrucomicrobiota bacterium]